MIRKFLIHLKCILGDNMDKTIRIFVRGDTHGDTDWVPDFCKFNETTKNDVMIILGDSAFRFEGADYSREISRKSATNNYNITFFVLRGNHDRPYDEGGDVTLMQCPLLESSNPPMWHDPNYPNLWYFQDGEVYNIQGHTFLTIGGAYSVDKGYRKSRGWTWYENEQIPYKQQLEILDCIHDKYFDYVLTHTCPFPWRPVDLFLPFVNQSTVDTSTEEWLEDVLNYIGYKHWYFGHYHADRILGRNSLYDWHGEARMFFEDIIELNLDKAEE